MMVVPVLGLATALPSHHLSQSDSAKMSAHLCRHSQREQLINARLYERSMIDSRSSVLLHQHNGNGHGSVQDFFHPAQNATDRGPGTDSRMKRYQQEAVPLALESARKALQNAAIAPQSITQLVVVTCTGFASPGVDIALIEQLGLSRKVGRTMVGFMGCHGAFNGLRIASALSQAHETSPSATDARVLMVAVELCSLHFAYSNKPQQIVANALFADGAAAVVTGPPCAKPAHHRGWSLCANGSVVVPDSSDAMTWHIGDHGFTMTLSPRVPQLITTHLKPWLTQWLAQHDLTIESIGSWAVHPGGPRILHAAAQSLDLPEHALDASYRILREHGNMSSPTILFILEQLQMQNAPRPCIALGFGPGLTIEAMLWM